MFGLKRPTTNQQNARAEQILEEFLQHKKEVAASLKSRGTVLEPDESHKFYEGWSAQKIAGLQLLVEYHAGVVAGLETEVRQLKAAVQRLRKKKGT